MRALLSFRPLFARHAAAFLLTMSLSLVTLAAGILLLGISGWFLTAAFLATAAVTFNLFGPSAAVRGSSMLRVLSRYGEKLVGHDATLRVLADIREWLFRALLPQGSLLARGLRHGDLVSRLTADVDALDVVFIVAIGPLVTGLVTGGILSAVLFAWLPDAGLVYALAMTGAAIVMPLVLVASTRRIGAEIVQASSALRTTVLDGLEGHMDLRVFDAAGRARADLIEAASRLSAARARLAARAAAATFANHTLTGVALVGVLVPGLAALERGALGGPALAGLALAVIGSFEATAMVVRSVSRLGAASAAAERLRDLAETTPAVVDAPAPLPLPDSADILFRNVTFGYGGGPSVLRGLDLAIGTGERVAIQGPSGGGKSTLLALLLRLADPRDGVVEISGTDIRTVAQADLHRHVALLEQNAPIFLGTIRDNLLIGRGDASDEDLWAALAQARLTDFVEALPLGLETELGEAGRTLSAGQARRLCLARTLLSPASILALDEPTSGLDRETERSFLQDMAQATAGRTVVLVTHADLPAGTVDRRYCLVDGCLQPEL